MWVENGSFEFEMGDVNGRLCLKWVVYVENVSVILKMGRL
jgi:hypothetical protein